MSARVLDWDYASRPYPGEEASGDGALVKVEDDHAVAVVVDGLGHGPAAADATRRVLDTVRSNGTTDLHELVERCHVALRDTRGAAMSVAMIDASRGSLTWLGVGNVEGRIVRAPGERVDSLMLTPGVVGHRLPRLLPGTLALRRGDLLVMATDGIDPAYADSLPPAGACGAIAQAVLAEHASLTDDALVVVMRYLGEQS